MNLGGCIIWLYLLSMSIVKKVEGRKLPKNTPQTLHYKTPNFYSMFGDAVELSR
jgi:hypothetical protein